MKKISSIILAVLLLSSLFGGLMLSSCAEETTTPTPTATTPTATTPTATTPTETPTTAVTPKFGGTLTVSEPIFAGQPIGYPPESQIAEPIFQQPCLEPLLWQSIDGEFHPRLATDWVVASDGSSVTFTLREGVKFHDGTDFDADAVKWNFDLLMEAGRNNALNWASVDVVDDHTVRVNLKMWKNSALNDFSFGGGNYIISPTSFEQNGIEWTREHMVGTGPFKQTDFVRDTLVAFEKFDDYWDQPKPYVDKLIYKCIPDTMVQEAAFKAEELDGMASGITPTLISLVDQGMVAVTKVLGVCCYCPDSVHPDSPLANEKFRLALEYGMNKEAFINAFSYGLFDAAYQFCPPTSAAYDPTLPKRTYDPDKAKQLLDESGFGPEVTINFLVTNDPPASDMSLAIAEQWEEIGIHTNIELLPSAKFEEYSRTGWTNGLLYVAPQGPSDWGRVIYGSFSSDPASTSYISVDKPQEYCDLIDAAVNSFMRDPEKQAAVVKYMYDHEMVIPTWNVCRAWVVQPYLKGGDFLGQASGFFWDAASVWLDK